MPYPSDMVQKDTFYFILDPLNGFNSRIKFIILFDSPSPFKKKKETMNLAKIFIPISQEKKKSWNSGTHTRSPLRKLQGVSWNQNAGLHQSLELKAFLKVYSSKAC